jgi:acyl dehydratase
MTLLYLEDLSPGRRFSTDRLRLDANAIKRFAREFDPQGSHLDEEQAQNSIFGELVASGWHTTAISMGLLVRSEFTPAGGIVGASSDHIRWSCPVRPGDELRVEAEILETRPSRTRPEIGIVRVRVTTFNQDDMIVVDYVSNIVVRRRPEPEDREP